MKNKFAKPQLLVIAIAVFLVLVISLLPKKPTTSVSATSDTEEKLGKNRSSEDILKSNKESLNLPQKNKIDQLENQLQLAQEKEDKLSLYDSLAFYWKVFNKPEAEAECLKQMAEVDGSIKQWFVAGDIYFRNFRASKNGGRKYSIQEALKCYNKVLDIDPNNYSAMNAVGVCYVEGSSVMGEAPMKGIGILKGILQKDPENIDALVNLGYFAIQSGQYDKAIERYNQVLQINESHIEAYLYLADIYVTTGKKEKAIESLEKYKSFVNDQQKVDQINEYIKELVKNN